MAAHRLRARLAYLALALFATSLAIPAAANDVIQVFPEDTSTAVDAASGDDTPSLWFVELGSAPLADGGSSASTRADKTAFRNDARRGGISYSERYAFDNLWNGLSIKIDRSQLGALSRLESVKALWPVVSLRIPDTVTTDEVIELSSAITMTGADIAQAAGYTGAGVKVAIMDTGVDYNHPDLGGCAAIGPSCRVITGYDFVGDDYDADGTGDALIPHPDNDPDDCNGHGTHVAGIVGANGAVTGVAPGVTFGAYRVFGCDGSTEADIMIAAMERLLTDGMEVLNMSIGSSFQWPQYPTAQASDRLVNKGVVVVASIGNSGANGLYSSGAPGVGSKVIGVASFDNIKVHLPSFVVDGVQYGYNQASGAPTAPTSGSLPMAKTGTATTTNDGCAALAPGSMTGKAVLIRRGTCTFYAKSKNAQDAGAAAVILYNNVAGQLNPTVAGTPAITIPVVAVTAADGAVLDGKIAAGPTTLTWTADIVDAPNPTGNLISSFSSYGLSPDLALKPDLGAPGGLIRSTYPLERGGYATISGTSMSSPHTAGAVALLLQANPRTPPNSVRDVLQNSADPHLWSGNPALGFLDNVHRQGAGMLDIPGAINATTRVSPGKLALGESQTGPATRTLTLTNRAATNVTYDLSHSPALSTGPSTFTPAVFTGFAAVSFSSLGVPVSSLVVPAGGAATVDVTITANSTLADRSIYGGYLLFAPQGGGAVYRVPYAGFKGDYQSITAVRPTTCATALPAVGKVGESAFCSTTTPPTIVPFTLPASSYTFTLKDGDVPYVVFHLDHQARTVRGEIFDTTGKAWHRAFEISHIGRNSAANSFFWITWNGITATGGKTYTVPNGTYVLKLSVLKALGDSANPAHWETWTSPVITLARP
ncbi:MAG TPA: S8 family serine peptidase [Candidatus Limnocylindria bacterium]|nr:S8 family serine peptidase [Candidatus Limnocylindria bacterium]